MMALVFLGGFVAGAAVGVVVGWIMRRHFGCDSFRFMF